MYDIITSIQCESSDQYSRTFVDIENKIECLISNMVNTRRLLLEKYNVDVSCNFILIFIAFNEDLFLMKLLEIG